MVVSSYERFITLKASRAVPNRQRFTLSSTAHACAPKTQEQLVVLRGCIHETPTAQDRPHQAVLSVQTRSCGGDGQEEVMVVRMQRLELGPLLVNKEVERLAPEVQASTSADHPP